MSKRGHVSVTKKSYERIKVEAEVRGKSMSQLVEEAIEKALGQAADASR